MRKALKRPICWVVGHESCWVRWAVFVSPHAPKPPATYCERCGKAPG